MEIAKLAGLYTLGLGVLENTGFDSLGLARDKHQFIPLSSKALITSHLFESRSER